MSAKFLSTIIVSAGIIMSVAATAVFTAASVVAQPTGTPPAGAAADKCKSGGILNFPRWYDGICENGDIKSPDKVGGLSNFIWLIVLNVIDMLLYVIGYVSLGFIIWGGFKYMISGDNASGTASARKTILNAVIGLVLSIMSVGIVNVVTGAVG